VLRKRMEIEPSDEMQEVSEQQKSEAQAYLDSYPATQRVSAESMELIWTYFRPFDAQRKREQKVGAGCGYRVGRKSACKAFLLLWSISKFKCL